MKSPRPWLKPALAAALVLVLAILPFLPFGMPGAAGEIRRLDPECLAYCLMGIADFLDMRWALWEDEVPSGEVFESMFSFIRLGMEPGSGE